MSSAIIQVQYEQLEIIAKTIAQINSALLTHQRQFTQLCDQLKAHGWEGEGADEFFAEVDDQFLPRVQRLLRALEQASQVVRQINQIMADAEDSAADQMRGAVITGLFPAVVLAKPITGTSDDRTSSSGGSTTLVSYTPTPPPDSTAQTDPTPQDVLSNPSAYTKEQIAAALMALMSIQFVNPNPPPATIGIMNNANGNTLVMVVDELAEAIKNGQLDGPSVVRLITTAQNEIASGMAYTPAGAALYMLAIADDQPALNEIPPEGEHTQFESLTGLEDYAQSVYESGPNGGNCANSASAAYYYGAGMEPYSGVGVDPWGLGSQTLAGVYAGDIAFRNAGPLDGSLIHRSMYGDDIERYTVYKVGGPESSYYGHHGARINDSSSSAGFPATNNGYTNIYSVSAGDLVFIYTDERMASGVDEHVAVIVGWGDPAGGPGSPFYPTYQEAAAAAAAAGETYTPTPYAVDHGGDTPQGYPRPYEQITTGGQHIYIADPQPMIGTPTTVVPTPTPTQTPTPTPTPTQGA